MKSQRVAAIVISATLSLSLTARANAADIYGSLKVRFTETGGKFGSAEDSLIISREFHSKAGQLADSDRCLICCAGKGNDPARAVRLAEEAARRIDSKARPDLAVSAIHALCWNLVDVGKPETALSAICGSLRPICP